MRVTSKIEPLPLASPVAAKLWLFWLTSSTRGTLVTVEDFTLTGQWIIKWGMCKSKCNHSFDRKSEKKAINKSPAVSNWTFLKTTPGCMNSSTLYVLFNFILYIDACFFYVGNVALLLDTAYRKYLQWGHKNIAVMKNALCQVLNCRLLLWFWKKEGKKTTNVTKMEPFINGKWCRSIQTVHK